MKKYLYPLALLAMPLDLHAATSASRGTFEPQTGPCIVCKIKAPLGDVASDTIRFIHYDSLGKPYAMQTTTELAYPIVRRHFYAPYQKAYQAYNDENVNKDGRFPYNNIDEYMYFEEHSTYQEGINKVKTHIAFWDGQTWINDGCSLAQLPLYPPTASPKLLQHMSEKDQELLTQSLQQGCIGRVSGFSGAFRGGMKPKREEQRIVAVQKSLQQKIGDIRPIIEYYYPQDAPLETPKGGRKVNLQRLQNGAPTTKPTASNIDLSNAQIGLFALIITFFGGLYYGSKRNMRGQAIKPEGKV